MTPTPGRSTLALALAFVAACTRGGGSTEIAVRDSAGVTIIEHPAGAIAASARWTLGPAITKISAGDTGSTALSTVTDARRLVDGRFIVVDATDMGSRLLLYAADGKTARQLGRNGMGPGEFNYPRIMGIRGDTLTVYDSRTARVTRVSLDGTPIDAHELARLGLMTLGAPVGTLPDGRLVSTPYAFGPPTTDQTGHYRLPGPIMVIDPVAVRLDTLSNAVPGIESFRLDANFGRMTQTISAPLGYGRRPIFGLSGRMVLVADNDAPDLVSYKLPWTPVRIVRLPHPRVPVDALARKALIDQSVAQVEAAGPQLGEMREAMLDNIQKGEFADSMAYWASQIVGTDGSVWLREMRSAADSVPHYLVVDPDGRLAARIDLPKGARLMWTDGTQALVVLLDDNDLPRLEVRPVVKGTSAN